MIFAIEGSAMTRLGVRDFKMYQIYVYIYLGFQIGFQIGFPSGFVDFKVTGVVGFGDPPID